MMADPLRHLSTPAEDAIGDIQLIMRDYRAAHAQSSTTTTVGRFSSSTAAFGDRAAQFVIANIVGIVEHYAEQILLTEGCAPNTIRTWKDKPTAWREAFDADIEDPNVCPAYMPMRGFYEVRTAVLHRRGELTHSQRNGNVYARLAAAGIDRVGYRIAVTESTVHTCANVCVRCVKELDATTRHQRA